MRVLQLYNRFGVATERTMLEVPLALAERGVEMEFAAEAVDDDGAAKALGKAVFPLPRIEVRPGDRAAVGQEMCKIAAGHAEVAGEFDVVHGHFGPRVLHGVRWTSGTREPGGTRRKKGGVMISCYGYDVSRLLRDRSWADRYRWAGERGVTFVGLSEAMAETLRDCGVPDQRVRVIPLGVDLKQWAFSPSLKGAGIAQGGKAGRRRFLFVGRATPKKGLDTLLRAMRGVVDAEPGVTLDVIGGGDVASRALAQALELEPSVRFHDAVAYETLGDWMRRATALVAPSQTAPDGDAEGCPMVLMLSQAVGTPTITTRHAGNAEALPESAQRFVVMERDHEALAAAMVAMSRLEPAERDNLRRAGRSWIEQRFDLRRTVERYAELYAEVAGVNRE